MSLRKKDFGKPALERVPRSKARHATNEAPFRPGLAAVTHRESGRPFASKRSPDESPDDYLTSDIGYYDVPAEGRFLRRVGFGVLKGGTVVAVGLAVIDATYKMTTAFTSFSSLLEGAAWGRFLIGLGALTKIGLLMLAGVLLWQLLRRRKRAEK